GGRGELEVAREVGGAGDGDDAELPAGRRPAEFDAERGGGRLGQVVGDVERAAGADAEGAAVGEAAGRREGGAAGERQAAAASAEVGDAGDRRAVAAQGQVRRAGGDARTGRELQAGAALGAPGAGGQRVTRQLADPQTRAERDRAGVGLDGAGVGD